MIIDKLEVKRFRGIKEARVEQLGRVNIFFGKNNCGKSTLLESVFLLSGFSNPILLVNINQWRGRLNFKPSDLDLNFYHLHTDEPIEIQGYLNNELCRNLEVSKFVSNSKSVDVSKLMEQTSNNAAQSHFGCKLRFSNDTQKVYNSEIIITKTPSEKEGIQYDYDAKVNIDKRYTEKIPAKIQASYIANTHRIDYLRDLIANKQERLLVEILSILDNRIKNISLIENDIMVDVGLSTLLPINVMGDGVRKLLSLVLSIIECKDGVFIVDELENGFHHSMMHSLWQILLIVSETYNVQLFLSTHNIDLIKELSRVLSDDENKKHRNQVFAHKLLRTDDDVLHALTYNYEKLVYSVEQEIEVR